MKKFSSSDSLDKHLSQCKKTKEFFRILLTSKEEDTSPESAKEEEPTNYNKLVDELFFEESVGVSSANIVQKIDYEDDKEDIFLVVKKLPRKGKFSSIYFLVDKENQKIKNSYRNPWKRVRPTMEHPRPIRPASIGHNCSMDCCKNLQICMQYIEKFMSL
jgi:hypothetical protein